jgi:hypothetical protein
MILLRIDNSAAKYYNQLPKDLVIITLTSISLILVF